MKQRAAAWPAAVLAATIGIGGCTTAPRETAIVRPPPAPPRPLTPPQPPAGASAGLAIPRKDVQGRYVTPNLGLGPAATMWHVRSALNVAALGCRGPQEATLIADYNRLLSDKRAVLAAAFARTEADARASEGKAWRDAHDRQMTRVYNFFAQPPAKVGFCAVAVTVAAEAAATPAAAFETFARAALPRLEAPFLDFYVRYDAYRVELAAWRAANPPPSTLAAAADAPSRRPATITP